jgi:hypothetical protein
VPKGRKNCQLCGQANKLRVAACIHCAHPFQTKEVKVEVKPEVKIAKEGGEPCVIRVRTSVVLIPNGPPPCRPRNISEPTEQDVAEWVSEIMSSGRQRGDEYTVTAVKYYARAFWDINSEQYKEVESMIDRIFNINVVEGLCKEETIE